MTDLALDRAALGSLLAHHTALASLRRAIDLVPLPRRASTRRVTLARAEHRSLRALPIVALAHAFAARPHAALLRHLVRVAAAVEPPRIAAHALRARLRLTAF